VRRLDAARKPSAKRAEQAEKARRIADDRRRSEQEAAARRFEAERLKAAKEAREEQERQAAAARRLADEEIARHELAREARETEAREQARLAALTSKAGAPPAAIPATTDQPYQLAAVKPAPRRRGAWKPMETRGLSIRSLTPSSNLPVSAASPDK
jgi:hypothetical protein